VNIVFGGKMENIKEITKNVKLSQELLDFISQWKDKKGNLIMVLHKVQQEFGYIPRDVSLLLTDLMDVPLAKIYGVVTFYHFFKLNKPGKHRIQVCMGTACYLKGAQSLMDEFSRVLGIQVGETTKDDEFTLEAVRCIGCCGLAPVINIDDEVYGRLTKDKLPEIIAKYKES